MNTLEQSLHLLSGHHHDQPSTLSPIPQSAKSNWTKVSYKRGRSSLDATERESKHPKVTQHWLHPPSTETSNRFSALMEAYCTDPLLVTFVVKTISVTGRGGLWGCEMSRIPHFLDNRLTVNCEILATFSSTYSPVRTSQKAHSVSIK
jgi:hypothetical protein